MFTVIDDQMIIIFMHTRAHAAYNFTAGIFRRTVRLDFKFFTMAKSLQRSDFDGVLFEEMSET